MARKRKPGQEPAAMAPTAAGVGEPYGRLVTGISGLVDEARRVVVRSANHVIVSTYWEIGRRIVEFEQGGRERAGYGEDLVPRLARDLTHRNGRGFSKVGLYKMRAFYLNWPILSTVSREFQTTVNRAVTPISFRLSWSHYLRLMSIEDHAARSLYESEAIRSGWSVRQLDRQISTQFFERGAGFKYVARHGELAPAHFVEPMREGA